MPPRRNRPRATRSGPPPAGWTPGAARLLVDGRNVQGALARSAAPGALPTSALIARLRAAFPPPTEVELILDGHAGRGPTGRIAPGFNVTYSRHVTADQVIGERVAEALAALGPAGAWSVVVVTDDHEVRGHARRSGARVEGTAWLAERLAGGASHATGVRASTTGIGHGRPPRPRSG